MDKKVSRAGKYMSLLLRHKPEAENLTMDKNGWVLVSQLISKLDIKFSDLEDIVNENNKKRFSFNENKTKIRANQGHSIDVDLQLEEHVPPDILYHGTSTRFLSSIYKIGLVKGSRQHIHLSDNLETATTVGARHGTAFVLRIDTKQMYVDGFKFYLSDNKVWLTDHVPLKYFVK